VGQLAVRPIGLAALLGQGEDRVPLGGQDAVHRPTRTPVLQLPVPASVAPAAHPLRIHVEHPAAWRVDQPAHSAWAMRVSRPALTSSCPLAGTGPALKSASRISLVQVQPVRPADGP